MEILNIPLGNSYIVQGDTISEILFEFDNTLTIDLTDPNVSIKMQIYNQNNKIIDINNISGITILNSNSFKINEMSKEDSSLLPYGSFLGDLEITDTNGKRITYFKVKYTIQKQYTK